MVAITKLIMLGISTVCIVTLVFIVLDFVADKVKSLFSKKRNRIKFYVARVEGGKLCLFIGKPIRYNHGFTSSINGGLLAIEEDFSQYGLDANDYTNLKWEDEPVEVFLNMED